MASFSCQEGEESLGQCADTRRFLELLGKIANGPSLENDPRVHEADGLFRWEDELVVTRAPGRLDVMGGIADYSGSLVLQMPLAEACHVAAQLQKAPSSECSLSAIRVVSFNNSGSTDRKQSYSMQVSDLMDTHGAPISYPEAQRMFRSDGTTSWASYVVGCLLVLMAEKGLRLPGGASLSLLVNSDVPEGKGVSSSAAVEVAAMQAVSRLLGLELEGRDLALLCQKVENHVVGAPCGIMDQMTSAIGRSGNLLALLCQPAEVQGFIEIPPHIAFWGLDSGLAHSVSGADYSSVRAGAFMGLAMATAELGQEALLGDGYLANIPPSEFSMVHRAHLPEEIKGEDFLERFGRHCDPVTTVDPGRVYAIRGPSEHPVMEHFRVRAFQQVMQGPKNTRQLELLGEVMYQSHASYSAIGLGSPGTDRIVRLVADCSRNAEGVLYGAKITGGGSGGTVCIVGESNEAGRLAMTQVHSRYEAERGQEVACFQGSSMGAMQFGHLRIYSKQ